MMLLLLDNRNMIELGKRILGQMMISEKYFATAT